MMTNVKFACAQNATLDVPAADLHSGEATGLFTTSMAPASQDMMLGAGSELFITSMAPQTLDAGAGTGLYTTSMVGGRDTHAGEATGLFTTSM